MRPDVSLLAVVLLPLLLVVLGSLLVYGVVRLAVRHGSLDARRRWRDESAGGLPPGRD